MLEHEKWKFFTILYSRNVMHHLRISNMITNFAYVQEMSRIWMHVF